MKYGALATKVSTEVAGIVQNCKLEPEADAQLHLVIADIMAGVEALPGVQRGTGRVSLENAALSFAFDPSRTSAETAQRGLRAKLQPRRLGVAHLRTL